jgi:neutral ceramidase
VSPPLGMPMEGLGQPGGCVAVHDELYARALYLRHGDDELVILSYDLLFFERRDVDRIKGAVGRRLGLPPRSILLNTSHNHAGPRLTRWYYSDGPDPDYLDQVVAATEGTAAAARDGAVPARLRAGSTSTDVPVSRRRPDGSGRVSWAPHPAGEVCAALPVCQVLDGAGRTLALLFSVSCHPSMIHLSEVTAEYPGVAARHLGERLGTQGAFFLQGCGGDAKPRPIAGETWRRGTWEEMERAGRDVADAVWALVEAGLRDVTPSLRSFQTEVPWPLEQAPDRVSLEALRDAAGTPEPRRRWASDMLRLESRAALPREVPVTLHVVQLGRGLRLVGLEGEAVGALGNRILATYRRGVTFPLGYTDGCQLYLPATSQLPEGGYEVESYWEYHWPARFARDAEERTFALLGELARGTELPDEPLA